jgi:hypothetical protein
MPGSLPTCPTIKPRRYRGIRASRITGGPIQYNGTSITYNGTPIQYN